MKRILLALPFLLLFLAVDAAAQEAAGKVFWRGMVDDKVHLVIRGINLEQRNVSGQPQPDGRFSFTAALPAQAVTVSVPRVEGRSKKVSIVQQPTAENEFTAIVEVLDEGGGARDYFLEIAWQ
jgi:hypothetical protein